MKKRYIFSLAALALLTAACSSDEMALNPADQPAPVEQKIPFTAVISADAAGTRALTEASDGKTITAKWEKEEKVALIHGEEIDVLEVSSVDATTGAATISGTITNPKNEETVYVVYVGHQHVNMSNYVSRLQEIYTSYKADNPESSAIPTSIISEPVNELLATQDGTLETISNKHDYRFARSTFAVSDGTATFASEVKMPARYAIWKLNLTTDGTTALKAKKLVMKKDGEADVTIEGTETSSEFYIAFIASPNTYSFEATTSDDKTYTCSPTVSTLDAGKFYRSTLKMAAAATGNTVDLSGKSADYTVEKNDILTGTLNASYKVIIPDGYSITLNGATINYGDYDAAAITCEGSATIIIADGTTNSVSVPGDTEGGPSGSQYPGILAGGTGTTLTFKGGTSGTGKLTVVGGYIAAGIGCLNTNGGSGYICGKIQIDGGIINAYSGNKNELGDGAETGIGSVMGSVSGDLCEGITINGGKVTAKGGSSGLGCGLYGDKCNFVTINGGEVYAEGGDCGISAITMTINKGQVEASSNGYGIKINTDLIIADGTIEATGNEGNAGISAEGNLTISGGTVTATSNDGGEGILCAGDDSSTITIEGGTIISTANGNNAIGLEGYNIIINDGTVTATGGEGGFGIESSITLGSGIKLYAGAEPNPSSDPVLGPQTMESAPETRYVVIK